MRRTSDTHGTPQRMRDCAAPMRNAAGRSGAPTWCCVGCIPAPHGSWECMSLRSSQRSSLQGVPRGVKRRSASLRPSSRTTPTSSLTRAPARRPSCRLCWSRPRRHGCTRLRSSGRSGTRQREYIILEDSLACPLGLRQGTLGRHRRRSRCTPRRSSSSSNPCCHGVSSTAAASPLSRCAGPTLLAMLSVLPTAWHSLLSVRLPTLHGLQPVWFEGSH
mmetsp:Transcript_111858/g.311322  ORF Transcript_111858/g.311322 Transcript_111858/m.311322 type:complete len:218 (+) Transcript_111858:1720-2373(+)